ncbi:NAD(P)H-dependent oxidoreductase [Sphingomonas sp. 10B4]|uniref:NADPH-dependent FMN reductase n=1 Tax=Sphingomonas sp. 10B4 TaxID=3048575 RepID=UPI002AB5077B|nr:NAD(P)H-dependent oxidoreductase [Sphingomonas sp. 10B4]MDY7525993.1 NAD(P)H-dependent oxidoreductase [Sphingomonas sp. 10B4]MEB0283244.1 NAD(P)H-dependent oxidoreductase [Sphingomonas sp. 10B4]
MSVRRKRIVGIGGTLRAGSSSERLVRAVLSACADAGGETTLFDGAALARFGHFNVEDTTRTDEQRAFIESVRAADGLVLGTPGYHGGVSGLVKNAIDLLEDLRGDTRPYFEGRPVGLIVSAAGWQAGGVTLSALRGIVHAMRGWPTPIGIAVNSVEQRPFDANGDLVDAGIASAVSAQARQIMTFALEAHAA